MNSTVLERPRGASPEPDSGRLAWAEYLGRVVLATLLAVLVSRLLNQAIMVEPLIPRPDVEGVGQTQYLMLSFGSALLVTAVLAYSAALSSLRGLALIQALGIAHFGLHHLLTMVEATVFLPQMTAREAGLSLFAGAIQSAVLAVCITAALGKMIPTAAAAEQLAERIPWWEWLWKFATCAVVYLVLYVVAGVLILPFVRQYYPDLESTGLQPAFIFPLQLRRGAVYVLCLIPLVRSLRASRGQIALATALLVPTVHGVAGLLVPNEHMAATAWRLAHMVEIGWSNFVFGLLIGYLFSRGLPGQPSRQNTST